MSALTGDALTRWRSNPHSVLGYLYIYNPTTVMACSVNQASFTYPLAQLTYDGVTQGAYGDIEVGQLVKVSSSAGVFKGWLRVRLAPTSSILYVGHVGQSEIDFEDDDLIVVLNDYRIFSRIPRLDADTEEAFKDYDLDYVDQNEDIPPKCNAGPHFAGFSEGGTASIPFDLTSSYAVADGASLSVYSGDLDDGSVVSGSIASGQFTASFPEGSRWCGLTVEDSNGKTHTMRVHVAALPRTGANAPTPAEVERLSYSDGGWEAKFNLLSTTGLDPSTLQEGSLVIYFEEEYYGGLKGSLNGYTGRESVKFIGWITEADISIEPLQDSYSITAVGPRGKLSLLPGFSQTTERSSSPDEWHEIAGMSVFIHLWYLLYWHSTALDVCDLERPGWYATYPSVRLDADQANLAAQTHLSTNAVGGALTCDHQGRFYARRNPMLMTDAERDSLTTVMNLLSSDWSGNIEVQERHHFPVSWVKGSGFIASTSVLTAMISQAGITPSQGTEPDQMPNQVAVSQAELNQRTGHYYAWKNNKYLPFTIEVFRGGLVADPAWMEWVKFTLDETTNRRGLSFDADRFLLKSVEVRYDPEEGTTTEIWTIEPETRGVPGVTVAVEDDTISDLDITPLPPYTPILSDYTYFDPVEDLPGPSMPFTEASVYYVATNSDILRCDPDTLAWESFWNAATELGAGFDIVRLRANPWDPSGEAWFIAMSIGAGEIYVYSIDDPSAASPTITLEHSITGIVGLSNASSQYRFAAMRFSINIDGFVGFTYFTLPNGGSANSHFVYRKTPTSSWTETIFNPASVNSNRCCSIGMGTHQVYPNGDIYAIAGTFTGGTRMYLYKSTDLGDTWSLDHDFYGVSGIDVFTQVCLVLPFLNNDGDEIVWIFSGENSVNSIMRRNADSSITTGLGVSDGGGGYYHISDDADPYAASMTEENAAEIWPGDDDEIRFIATTGPFGSDHFVYSEDGGDNWTAVSINTFRNPAGGNFRAMGGWPSSPDIILAFGDKNLGYSADKFSSYNDLRGSGATELFTVSSSQYVVDFYAPWVP